MIVCDGRLITDRVRSMREGSVLTPVCPSICLSTPTGGGGTQPGQDGGGGASTTRGQDRVGGLGTSTP